MIVHDAAVVGAGPAGLAFAIAAARRGLDVVVLERREGPLDKACGEGLLPAGRRALEALGAAASLDPTACSLLRELSWVDPDGLAATARLPDGGGLGVRRTALSAALRARAADAGAELRTGVEVVAHRRSGDRIIASLAGGEDVEARVLVAADGLASPVRRREGLDQPVRGAARFGIRRHFAVAPWSEAVEVHFDEGVEAYVTPVGPRRVGVAFLFERARRAGGSRPGGGELSRSSARPERGAVEPPGAEARAVAFDALMSRFPGLHARLSAALPESEPLGAGPLARRCRARVADRLVLLGDAAGYLDAITGEGLSLAFGCALDLAALLPGALAGGASAAALRGYEDAWRRRYRSYQRWTRLMLQLARHAGLRRAGLRLARVWPGGFERIVAAALGAAPAPEPGPR